MHLFNRFVTVLVCDRPATKDYAIGLVPMVGIGVHSLIDRIIYSVTFSVGTVTGVASAIGMVLHEFPEGIFTYVLLRKGGMKERTASVVRDCRGCRDDPGRHLDITANSRTAGTVRACPSAWHHRPAR
jgi:hypothetical protein